MAPCGITPSPAPSIWSRMVWYTRSRKSSIALCSSPKSGFAIDWNTLKVTLPEAQKIIWPGGKRGSTAAGSRLRDSKDAAYVGATLKTHVSCRPPQGHGLADQHHSTYVPATILGALLQVGCPRANNDKGKSALMGTAKPKVADCTSAIGARRKAPISL